MGKAIKNKTTTKTPEEFADGASGNKSACRCRRHEMRILSLGQEHPLEEGIPTYSSILAWKIS